MAMAQSLFKGWILVLIGWGVLLKMDFLFCFSSSHIHQHKLPFLPSFLAFLTTDTVSQLIHLESSIS